MQLFELIYDSRTMHEDDLKNAINEFVEKPQRKVQVGDIYLDTDGIPRKIICLNGESRWYPYGGDRTNYNENGISDNEEPNIDLSKPYKLVENKDAD